jgi:hypothetical protein
MVLEKKEIGKIMVTEVLEHRALRKPNYYEPDYLPKRCKRIGFVKSCLLCQLQVCVDDMSKGEAMKVLNQLRREYC